MSGDRHKWFGGGGQDMLSSALFASPVTRSAHALDLVWHHQEVAFSKPPQPIHQWTANTLRSVLIQVSKIFIAELEDSHWIKDSGQVPDDALPF